MGGGDGGGGVPKLLVLGLSRKKSSYNVMELNLTEIISLLLIDNTFYPHMFWLKARLVKFIRKRTYKAFWPTNIIIIILKVDLLCLQVHKD